MNKTSKIYVAGHRGLLGSAIVRRLLSEGFSNLLLKTSRELDLTNQEKTTRFLEEEKPDYVFLCAAKVGGIRANMQAPAEFFYQNLQIQNNVIDASKRAQVKKLLFVASSCIYPRETTVPIKEDQLMTGPLEPTNEGYALAKIAGIRMTEFYRKQYGCNFISAIPTNLFGINDNYNLQSAHLLPALIHKIHLAKQEGKGEITIWGTGKPRREFMLSDDCADALVFLMKTYDEAAPVNVGLGHDWSVTELAQAVARVMNAKLEFKYDVSQPDGTMRKMLDASRLTNMGWQPKYDLDQSIKIAIQDFYRSQGRTAAPVPLGVGG